MTIMFQFTKTRSSMEITKIKEVYDEKMLTQMFEKAFGLKEEDLDIGICELDIENAFDALSQEDKESIDVAVKKKRIFTNVYLHYGYQKVYADSKEEASRKKPDNIKWNKKLICLKAAPSRYLHEIRYIQRGSKRVTHCYSGNVSMNEEDVLTYINDTLSVDSGSVVEYYFIVDGVIKNDFLVKVC